ncbi:MAG: tRNA (N6-isopentenyl adenosine(37)-C2)-methylthiotransferase MiaB [Rhodospirillales bacterium]|nr:tRNA (N6-isopentenyl adenosine(37)-C2)-methylthiotransferase MiaB [Rhodospirillales bacterium]
MTGQDNKKLYIKTWGCQMNVYDSQRMADVLAPLGYKTVESPEDADMMILNTCHIREKATEKVFSELGRLRDHKDAKEARGGKMLMAVAGCVAQAEGGFIMERAPYVDMVFGPQTYHELPEMVVKATGERVINTELATEEKFDALPGENRPTGPAAFLSVQEGCDKFCTYCVVPYTRGAEVSRPVMQILDEAKRIRDAGAKEITLLGQNVNAFHGENVDGKTWGLAQLIEAVAEIEGIERIRYTTSHPGDMQDDLLEAHGHIEKLMPYLHLPVQSGSNTILKAMNRKHTAESYLETIEKLRKIRPDIALSGDFIVGFPGETDEDFEATMDLVRKARYASAYSFKYSARPGTPAAGMKKLVRPDVMDERLQHLQDLLNDQGRAFNERCVGLTMPVLLERKGKEPGQLHGRSPYNQSVHVEGNERLLGHIVDVEMITASKSALRGRIATCEMIAKSA